MVLQLIFNQKDVKRESVQGNLIIDWTCKICLMLGIGLTYLRTLAPSITWANGGGDSGDFVTAAATWGVAHPTGYPTYLLLARLCMLVPVGELAYRVNLLSAVAAVVTTLCVYGLIRRLVPEGGLASYAAASLAALALGLSPLFWSQAVIAEVYALNGLFVVLLLRWTLDATRGVALGRWAARLRPVVVGLALGNHVTIALPVAVWVLAGVMGMPAGARLRWLARSAGWVAVGLLVYLYLPLAAMGNPPVNWGDPRDWAGFWWVVSGRLYQGLAFGMPFGQLYGRLAAWAGLLSQQFGWVGLLLGFGGLLYAPSRDRRFLALSAVVAIGYSAFAIGYATDDSDSYLLPAFLVFALWVGLGLAAVLGWTRARWRWSALLVVPLALALFWNVPTTMGQVDASSDHAATDYATTIMTTAPQHALVVTSDDLDSFPLWYVHYALGQRPDLVIVVDSLLDFGWYRDNLRAVYPELHIPVEENDDWAMAIMKSNPTIGAICRTELEHQPPLVCQSH